MIRFIIGLILGIFLGITAVVFGIAAAASNADAIEEWARSRWPKYFEDDNKEGKTP